MSTASQTSSRAVFGWLAPAVDFALVSIPKAGGAALLLALNLLLVRVLAPQSYGEYSLCLAAILLSEALIGSPLDYVAMRLAPGGAAVQPSSLPVEQAVLKLKAGVSLGLSLVLATAAGVHAGTRVGTIVLSTGLAVAAILVLRSVQLHLQLRGRFLAYAAVELLHIAGRYGGVCAALLLGTSEVRVILIVFAAGSLVAAGVGAAIFGRGLLARGMSRGVDYRSIRELAGWYVATTALGATVGRMDILMLGWLGSAAQAGLFSAGHVVAAAPELLGSYLAVVLTPRILPASLESTLHRLFRDVQIALLGSALVFLVVAVAIWDQLWPLLLPPSYSSSAAVTLILLPGTVAAMMTVPLALPIVMFWRRSLLLRADCIFLPAAALAYAAFIPQLGEIGAAWVSCLVYLARSLLVQVIAWRCVRAGPSGPIS